MKKFVRKYRKKIITVITLLIIVLSVTTFVRIDPLLIKNVIVKTDYDVKENSGVWKIIEESKEQNYLFFSEKKSEDEILKRDIKIGKVDVQKVFPNKILINIYGRWPLAALPNNNNFLFIDEEGIVYDSSESSSNLPLIYFNLKKLQIGSRIEGESAKILNIVKSLKTTEEIKSGIEDNEKIEIENQTGTKIIFPLDGDLNRNLQALQTILARFKIEGKRLTKVDLRFEKPVVSF